MLKRLTEGTAKLSEEEALRRLAGLFVGKENHAAKLRHRHADRRSQARPAAHARLPVRALPERTGPARASGSNWAGRRSITSPSAPRANETLARLFGPAGIVGLALAYWCLRSTRLTMMVFVTALYAGAISLSLVYYSGSAMNAILLTMPAVVYVAGISGAIHFANYYRGSAVEGGVEGAPARAVHHAWIPCTLSAITSAAGLASLYTSELIPIKMFGVYTALGVLTTLLLLFLFLPAWMQLWPMHKDSALDGEGSEGRRSFAAGRLAAIPVRRPAAAGRWCFAAGVVLAGHLRLWADARSTPRSSSPSCFRRVPKSSRITNGWKRISARWCRWKSSLRVDNTASSLTMLERAELVGRIQKSLKEIDEVGNTMSAVTFAPPLEAKRIGRFSASARSATSGTAGSKPHREEYIEGGFLAMDGDTELWRINARVERAQRRRLWPVSRRSAGQGRAGAARRADANP